MSKDITTIVRGTVIEVGSSGTTGATAFVRLARNDGELVIDGLSHAEARDIASSHFAQVISVTIQRSSK
ncbi:hypothetical protein H4CHR_04436 [Variovorax sp. PBS-H4]|uniref:hypothetical protein n=1 Tax=Variovorax sp. PBS-H4 TaxID=434008 RepID=UPI0013180FE2|nr:hypothetical protein [Variovorax sp. PBS-H4]VTU38480.1 hypothetical protein H4CHR_04436 [Variovorax sp. PBS-H4]